MTKGGLSFVVDASVGVKLFIQEELSDLAQALFDMLADDPPARLCVPDLFFIECANVLWKHARKSGYPEREALTDIRNLRRFNLAAVSTRDLMEPSLKMGMAWGVTAYDACYVVLAAKMKIPFITADETLVRKLKEGTYPVRWLGDFKPQPE